MFNFFGFGYILISAAGVIVSLLSLKSPDNVTESILSIALSTIALIMSGAKQFFRYGEVAEKHRAASLKFDALLENIQKQLKGIKPGESDLSERYTDFIQKQYKKIVLGSPPIGNFVTMYFNRRHLRRNTIESPPEHAVVRVSMKRQKSDTEGPDTKRQRYELERYLEGDYQFIA